VTEPSPLIVRYTLGEKGTFDFDGEQAHCRPSTIPDAVIPVDFRKVRLSIFLIMEFSVLVKVLIMNFGDKNL
jgi:hypothetical protein